MESELVVSSQKTRFVSGALICSAALLSACGGGGGGGGGSDAPPLGRAENPIRSSFVEVTSNNVDVKLADEQNGNIRKNGVGAVAFVVGIDSQRAQIVGFSGVKEGANVGTVLRNTNATYSTDYKFTVATNVDRDLAEIRADTLEASGRLTLNADFTAGTLKGASGNQFGGFDVDAKIDGQDVDGKVTAKYLRILPTRSISGPTEAKLKGKIGSDAVIGAFQGTDNDSVLVGGLIGTKN